MKKRILALCMAVAVTFTTIATDVTVYAGQNETTAESESEVTEEKEQSTAETETQTGKVESTEAETEEANSTEAVAETEEAGSTETTSENVDSTEAETEEIDSTKAVTETTEDNTEETEETQNVNYAMVESEYIELPGSQNVVVGLGDGETELSDVQLNVQNLTTGEIKTVETSNHAEDMFLFTMEFMEKEDAGIYQLKSINYRLNEKTFVVDFLELEMDIQFGVNADADANPDEYIRDEETVGADIVTTDEDGNVTSENNIEDVLSSSMQETLGDLEVVQSSGNLVVMLDPGHDDTHAGAQANGAGEEDLVLAIAQYCKTELETYSGVTVYMTRSSGACPNGGSTVTPAQCNAARVAYASSVGANVYVSFHLNSSTSTSANGVGVYYPNSNYNASIGETGKGLATAIYNKLRALGLSQWSSGILIRNSEDGTTYPDGSLADYLGVIRRCKEAGIPAVLIEHAFISGTSDYSNFLNSDEKLKALGVADATGIAEYYGLVKKSTKPTITYTQSIKDSKIKVAWTAIDGAASYYVYRSTSSSSGYKKIATVSGTDSYTDTSVKTGKEYYYKVRAAMASGTVSQSSDYVAGCALAQAKIKSVRSKSTKKIEVNWGKVTGAEGYYIYRRSTSSSGYEVVGKVASGSTLQYIDTVDKDGEKYYYRVKAYNTCLGIEGAGKQSETQIGKSLAKPVISTIVSKSQSALEITWSKVAGASGYTVKRSTSESGGYEAIATISSGSTVKYKDASVTPGTKYYYRIQAYHKADEIKGFSGYGTAVSGKTAVKTTITSVASKNSTTLSVKWKKVSGASGYIVKRATSKSGTYNVIATITSGSTVTYNDTTVTTGKVYYYKVETTNSNTGQTGYSGNSSAVYGKTIEKTAIDNVISKNSTTLEITWNKVSGAVGYRVKRSTSKTGTYKVIAIISSGSTVKYTDRGLSEGKRYYYKIECMNKVNGTVGYSGNSIHDSGQTVKQVELSSVQGKTSTSLSITWKQIAGVAGYQVFRSTSKDDGYKKIATISGASTTQYIDDGLTAGKTYYYRVRAYKKNNKQTEIGTSSTAQKAWAVKQPVISGISVKSGKTIVVSWGKVSRSSGYTIFRRISSDSSYKKVGTVSSADTLEYSDTNVSGGKIYYYRVCANSSILGDNTGRGDSSSAWKVPLVAAGTLNSVSLGSAGALTISWEKVSNAAGYQLAYATSKSGKYTQVTKTSSTSYTHSGLTSGSTYYYKVRAYAKLADGSKIYGAWSSVKSQTVGYLIMGSSDLTVSEMVSYYNARYTYPADVYSSKGASTAKKFFTILKEEAEAEGVKTEVLFAQVILETGGLQFGGDVKAEQCNFGGLGAVGGGASGETYANVRTGLRAQVQHLKAYASTEDLNNTCVDTRFKYVTRGTAPYVEWLSIPNNPYGKGWASDASYGTKLLNIINSL